MKNFTKIDMHKKKSDALIVHCSDPRFQAAYRSLIDGLEKYYDLLVFPGASKAIAENGLIVENIKLLHALHHFRQIHIFDHVQCGAFGELDDEVAAHKKMLNDAKFKLAATLPQVKVVPHLIGESSELHL